MAKKRNAVKLIYNVLKLKKTSESVYVSRKEKYAVNRKKSGFHSGKKQTRQCSVSEKLEMKNLFARGQ